MSDQRVVDVNLFVRNGAATIAEAVRSVLGQTWGALTLTIIDNGSTDGTADVARAAAEGDPRLRVVRNRGDVGPVLNCQRAFWFGDADFVMPKTADDMIAPDYVESLMEVMLAAPETAMCHAGAVVFGDDGRVRHAYPAEHRLMAVGPDPVERARHVMGRYTSAPSFWGVYRRSAVERLAPLTWRPGWDHAVLAELAIEGEIRSIAAPLFWRRHGGKEVGALAKGCSQFYQRGHGWDDPLADLFWRVPLIGTAWAHVERFAVARLPVASRVALMDAVGPIFRARWEPMMRAEAARLRVDLPAVLEATAEGMAPAWAARQVRDVLSAVEAMLPDLDFADEREVLDAFAAIEPMAA